MAKGKKREKSIDKTDLNKEIGEGDPRMKKAILGAVKADGTIDWGKVTQNLKDDSK